jgi:hypothetical protein
MEAAGGIDYMVMIASKALRARPKSINFAAPFVSYLLCILTGTSNTFYSIIPVINEVSYANKIRPERPLAGSTVASGLGITSSPVAAAMATILPLVEVYHYNLVDVLLITIPASIIGIFVPVEIAELLEGSDGLRCCLPGHAQRSGEFGRVLSSLIDGLQRERVRGGDPRVSRAFEFRYHDVDECGEGAQKKLGQLCPRGSVHELNLSGSWAIDNMVVKEVDCQPRCQLGTFFREGFR